MRAAVLTGRRVTTAMKMAKRRVYSTDNPNIFEVKGSDPSKCYTVYLVRGQFVPNPTHRLQCTCEWGVNAGLVPADSETLCWHIKLVIQRRLKGGSNGS